MGSTYTYKCNACNYSANVSGGPDVGFVVKTQTGFCMTCNDLVDYVTEVWAGDGETEKGVVIGACHTCKNAVTRQWNDGDQCPRCSESFALSLIHI